MTSDISALSEAEFRKLIFSEFEQLKRLLSPSRPTDETLTTEEAAKYVKRPHLKAFERFRQRTGLKSYSRGRYSRRACDAALAREQRGYRKEASA